MDFHGRYIIPASPETVWDAIRDPEVLKACIPGCESVERSGDTEFQARAILKIGPLKATFAGKVALAELDPPRRCLLKGEGQGGVAGFARGEAEVLLAPEGDGTALSYMAKTVVGGELAQIGQRLIDGAAKQIADDFFARFAQMVRAEPLPEPQDVGLVPELALAEEILPPPTVDLGTARPREGLKPEIWMIGLITIMVILLVLFGVSV
ncbi:MAG TPA: carbon monoxide dehydrogenase subunit G [Rhizomicrobium sp.]|jgi:carbon monoxide dehydrogenase subunit G|nr:carbon monoxide dehydrogenase subunit G [Rhizomicrobium sp.]